MDFTDSDSADFSLNPSFGMDPSQSVRSISLASREVYPETSSAILTPLSTTLLPPGSVQPSLAPKPGQPVDLVQGGADLRPQMPQVAQAAPPGLPGVAPPLQSPRPTTGPQAARPPQSPFSGSMPQTAPSAVDPQTDALQKEYDQLKKDADFQLAQGRGWFKVLMDPDDAEKQRGNWEKTQQRMHEIEQKIQVQNNNQNMAQNYHLFTPMANTADAAAIPEQAIKEVRTMGNVGAWSALMGSPHAERAKGYTAEFMNAVGKDAVKANDLYSKLDDAAKQNQPEYTRRRDELLKEAGKVNNAQYFGMTAGNIPTTREEWMARRDLIQGPIKTTTQMVNSYVRQQQDQMAPKLIAGEAGTAVLSDSTQTGGAPSPNARPMSLPSLGGAAATQFRNSTNDIRDYRQDGKWTDWGTAQKQAAAKMISENPEIKGVLDQHNMAVKFNNIVQEDANYKDSTGRTMIADSAAGTFRNISEMARAAGNIGLIRVWEHEMGILEKTLNQANTNWGTYLDWIRSGSKGAMPEIPREDQWSAQTKAAFKRIGQFNLEESSKLLGRASGVAGYVGEHAGSLEHVGFSPEAAKVLKPYRDAAEQQHRIDLDSHDRVIINGRHYELPTDHSVDPNTPGFVKAGAYAKSIQAVRNNSTPATVVPAGGSPTAPGGSPSTPGGGGGPPVVTPPAGGPPVPPAGGPGGGGGGPAAAATVPAYLRGNPVASTVYSTSAQTATNLSGGNATVGNNVAALVTSSAQNESSFKPHELHDKNVATGEYAGYGLFGHQGDRLGNMQQFAGNARVGKPDQAIAPEAQTRFYTREIMDAAKKDPFIAKVLSDPNASAEDLTRVQMRMEKPQGYVQGQEEKGMNWDKRLAATQTLLLGQRGRLTSTSQQAEANYNAGQSRMMRAIPQNAPAIGATAANIATTPFGPGVQAGATVLGGVTGGVIKNAMTGTPEQQTWGGYTEAGVKGGMEALPMTIPGGGWKSLAGRALTAGAVEGGIEAYDTGEIPKALNVAAGSTFTSAASEAFMLALGKGFSGIYKMATNNNRVAMENAGQILSEQKPKTMLADGTTVENKAYTTAEEWAKSKNIDPDHLAHAYEQARDQATRGEALTSRPGYVGKREAGRALDKVVYDTGAATAGTSAAKAQQVIADVKSPVNRITSGQVPPAFRADAETAARTMAGAGKPPPTNFGQVMDNFAQARTDLLYKRANAEAITPNHPDFARKQEIIKAYDDLGQHIRLEQEKLIRGTLPLDQQQPLIDHLRAASARYHTAVVAGGDDIVATIAAGGAKANQARTAFNNLAGNDQDAKNMMQALTTMKGRTGKITSLAIAVGASQALHAIPIVGTVAAGAVGVLSAAKLGQLTKDFMVQRGSGKIVTMKSLIGQELAKTGNVMRRGGATIGGSVGANVARSLVQPAQPAPASP